MSIPFDPTLALGQLLELEKIENLAKMAAVIKPAEAAYQKLNNVIRTSYKLKMLKREMTNIGIEEYQLRDFDNEILQTKRKIAQSAIHYGEVAVKATKKMEALENSMKQDSMSFNIESPLDYSKSKVTRFPLAFDSLTFDVQYQRNESNVQSDESSSKKTTNQSAKGKKQGGFLKAFGAKDHTTVHAHSQSNMVQNQTSNHDIEGTVVITARATHKNAQIISPFVIDPIKAVDAWNYTFPEDPIATDSDSIIKAALENFKEKPDKKPSLKLLSGCSTGSSFVGFLHILKEDKSSSKQTAKGLAEGMKKTMQQSGWFSASSGGYGQSKSVSNSLKNMLSTSRLSTHCSLICRGIIPSIVTNDVATSLQKMEIDPAQVMEQLAAISDANNQGVNSAIEAQKEEGKVGAQFMSLNSDYLKNAVSSVSESDVESNKVLDANSLMQAFEDFVQKAMAGEGGVPMNFYIKNLTKNDIAKIYIRKFYPNGITSSQDAQRGAIGQEPVSDSN